MAARGISADRAYLIAIWLETLLYGTFKLAITTTLDTLTYRTGTNLVLCCCCMIMLTVRRRTPQINRLLVAITLIMFALSTAHVSLGLRRLIEGFIVDRDNPGGPAAYFEDISLPENLAKISIHVVNVRDTASVSCI